MNEIAPWSMTEDGEWILNEPYKTVVDESKRKASIAWQTTICDYLSERTPYTVEQLVEAFLQRVMASGDKESKYEVVGLVDSFIIEALEGSL